MGPTRFPETIQYAGTNETLPINDQKLVFQLADVMNELNKGQPNFTVNFIPWIQSDPNGLYYFNGIKKPNGLPPTVTEVKNNKNLTAQIPVDPLVEGISDAITDLACNPNVTAAAAKNVFAAHKAWLDTGLGGLGGDDWSEFAYFHNYLNYSLNATDQAFAAKFGGAGDSFWEYMYTALVTSEGRSADNKISYECGYFSAIEWRTIDGVYFSRTVACNESATH